jgi:transposase-like protein
MLRKYDDEFKRNAVRKVLDWQSVRSVSQESGVNESQIHKWKRSALANGDGVQSRTELAETAALHSIFVGVIEKYFNGERDNRTLRLLENLKNTD